MTKIKLTKEQEIEICYLIGEWYLFWKNKIVDNGCMHRLGVAKKDLKMMICEDTDE